MGTKKFEGQIGIHCNLIPDTQLRRLSGRFSPRDIAGETPRALYTVAGITVIISTSPIISVSLMYENNPRVVRHLGQAPSCDDREISYTAPLVSCNIILLELW